jgi:hypothetical protein
MSLRMTWVEVGVVQKGPSERDWLRTLSCKFPNERRLLQPFLELCVLYSSLSDREDNTNQFVGSLKALLTCGSPALPGQVFHR